MLGLAETLAEEFRTTFVSFSETGLCRAFLEKVRLADFEGLALEHDTPRLLAATGELTGIIRRLGANVVCCHGYKANLLGLLAARRAGVAAIAVSRGWTAENFRIRLYEALDRRILRWMDRVVCVSAAQAAKVRMAGVRADRIEVIYNAVFPERLVERKPERLTMLRGMFPEPPALIVGAAGRLSPEKGFNILAGAAHRLLSSLPPNGGPVVGRGRGASIGFVLFGDGPQRDELAGLIAASGLEGKFTLAGFHPDFDRFLPHFDLFVQASFTEGLPNVVLEAQAAGVPVVATSVGGTPEIIDDGRTGWLVPAGDVNALAAKIGFALSECDARRQVSQAAIESVRERFSFTSQAKSYRRLFAGLGAIGEELGARENRAGLSTERLEVGRRR
jgi:glycosyltransferase involved in cell wall biosynthesis